MRVALVSDLHLEHRPAPVLDTRAFDVLVAAGDIGQGFLGIDWLISLDVDAVYVLGNHEFWGCDDFEAHLIAVKARAKGTRVRVLENSAVVIGSVRFLGATLWVDYAGTTARMRESYFGMNDFVEIGAASTHARWASAPRLAARLARLNEELKLHPLGKKPQRVHPAFLLERHQASRRWLHRELTKPFAGPTVVVSHHAPTQESLMAWGLSEQMLQPSYRWSFNATEPALIASYASANLAPLLKAHARSINAWCHGHTHQRARMRVEGVSVYCHAASVEPFIFDPEADSAYAPLAEKGQALINELKTLRNEFETFARRLPQASAARDEVLFRALLESAEARAVRFDKALTPHVEAACDALQAAPFAVAGDRTFSRIGRPFWNASADGYLRRALWQLERGEDDEFNVPLDELIQAARLNMSRAVRQLSLLPAAVRLQRRAVVRMLKKVVALAAHEGHTLRIDWPRNCRFLEDARPTLYVKTESARCFVENALVERFYPKGQVRDFWLDVRIES